ncbi:hypothetical protein ASPBRDRAFT_670671, partial [Aspergillus brasiliensis CBS 101740]
MAAWCPACLFRLDPICAIPRYSRGGATGVFNGGDWLGGRFQKLKGLALRTRQRLVGQPYYAARNPRVAGILSGKCRRLMSKRTMHYYCSRAHSA